MARRKKSSPAPAPDPASGLVRVYPGPGLAEGEYLPQVGIDGADVSPELAAEWLERDLVTTTAPAAPAEG